MTRGLTIVLALVAACGVPPATPADARAADRDAAAIGDAARADASPDAATVGPGIAITSPVPNTRVHPGDLVAVTVAWTGTPSPDQVVVAVQASVASWDQPPFTGDVTVPDDAVGPIQVQALAIYPDGATQVAAPVDLQVVVDVALVRLDVINNDVFVQVGRTYQVRVAGTYADGSRRDLTRGVTGTRYAVTQGSPVVQVSDDGAVTALAVGSAALVIMNGDVRTGVSVKATP